MPSSDIEDHWVWDLYEKGLTLIPLGTAGEKPPSYLIQRAGSVEEATNQWPKTPRERWADWQKHTPSHSQIEEWLLKYPGCNFGIVTGKEVNVVDADDEAAIEFVRANLTRTPWVVKTGKGAHFYYQVNACLAIKNSADESARLDTRGVGGYVVAPGSTHASGRVYELEVDPAFPVDSVHDLPVLLESDWQKILDYRGAQAATSPGLVIGPGTKLNFDASKVAPGIEQGVSKGGRDSNLVKVIGRLISDGLPVDQVLARALEVDARNVPPLGEATVIQKVQSVIGTHARNNIEEIKTAPQLIPANGIELIRVTDMDLAKPIDYLIDDFLIEQTTSLIWGPPGCGKSFVAIDMGLHVATGRTWHGHEVSQGDVIYICGEGFNGIPLRVAAWMRHHEIEGQVPFYMTRAAVPIAVPGAAKALMDSVNAISANPKLIIIDTLNRNFGGGSENDQEDMDLYLNASHLLCSELGANVLTVHHSGKDAARGPRGSTGLTGAVYTNMEMKKEPDLCLITHKQKDGPEAPPIKLELPYIPLGQAKDNRGRIRDIGSLVVEVVDDISIGATLAAGITGKDPRKRAGKNQAILIRACRKQVENIPAGSPQTIDRRQLNKALDICGLGKERRSEVLKWAENEGILVPESLQNALLLNFTDPK